MGALHLESTGTPVCLVADPTCSLSGLEQAALTISSSASFIGPGAAVHAQCPASNSSL